MLVDLVRKYEADRSPIPLVSGSEVVRHLIEARGVTQAEVSFGTGVAESSLSELLAGKRKMAVRHARALARFFGVSVDTIIGG